MLYSPKPSYFTPMTHYYSDGTGRDTYVKYFFIRTKLRCNRVNDGGSSRINYLENPSTSF